MVGYFVFSELCCDIFSPLQNNLHLLDVYQRTVTQLLLFKLWMQDSFKADIYDSNKLCHIGL